MKATALMAMGATLSFICIISNTLVYKRLKRINRNDTKETDTISNSDFDDDISQRRDIACIQEESKIAWN